MEWTSPFGDALALVVDLQRDGVGLVPIAEPEGFPAVRAWVARVKERLLHFRSTAYREDPPRSSAPGRGRNEGKSHATAGAVPVVVSSS